MVCFVLFCFVFQSVKHGFKLRPRIQTLATLLINLVDFRKASPNSTNLDVLICRVDVQTVVKIQCSRALEVPTLVLGTTQVLYKEHSLSPCQLTRRLVSPKELVHKYRRCALTVLQLVDCPPTIPTIFESKMLVDYNFCHGTSMGAKNA